MKRHLNDDELTILRLARGLLNIARQKMNAYDMEDDKRCRYARRQTLSICPKSHRGTHSTTILVPDMW